MVTIEQHSLTLLGGSATETLTVPATQPGSLLIVAVLTGFAHMDGVTDDGSQAWVHEPGADAQDDAHFTEIWFFPNTAAGITSIFLTMPFGIANWFVEYWEVSGMATAAVVDTSGEVSNTSQSNTHLGPALTTLHANDFIVAFMGGSSHGDGPITVTEHAGDGFTLRDTVVNDPAPAASDQITVAVGTFTAQWDYNHNFVTIAASSVAFKAAEPVPPTPQVTLTLKGQKVYS